MDLVTGVIGSLLAKLGELLKDGYHLETRVQKKIESLSRELRAAQAVLRKIGEVPKEQFDELARLWASEVREASYDMEDIVDAFLVQIKTSPEPTDTNMLGRLLKKVGTLIEKFKARRKISSLIDDINQKLVEVAARRGTYTLDGIAAMPAATNIIDPRIFHLYRRVTELVGIKRPRSELIKMLSLGDDVDVPDNKEMKIVSIVGFGGLGKTTLARAVYDHLKPRFQCWAFVPVGRNPDIKKLFKDILIALDEETYTHSKLTGLDENQLMGKLNGFVKEKRCLIVIDDIWDKETWKFVRCALQESNCGSRLVITTRISEIAAYAGKVYKMQPLSHNKSKELLYARIVDGEGKYVHSPSAEACERILKKCGGVPLAIITIASLLASKPGDDWSEIYNSIGFGHKANDDVENTRKILSFSYYDLPSHLKTCLLYLSVFPEDHVIEKNSLIWMWVAEGFITEEQAAKEGVGSLFDLGQRYFNELINRSMIQAKERRYEGYIGECSVHDMVLDLIHELSSEENFVTVLNGGEQQKPQGSMSRRLALQRVQEHSLANISVEKVRSIFTSDCKFCALCIPRLPFLRVVEIVGWYVCENCCNHLGSLVHLRYFSAPCANALPRELRYLRFLQTLDVSLNRFQKLPEEVGHLTQLVCLRIYRDDDGATIVPAGLIEKLTSLQELCIGCYGEDATMQFAKELGLLRQLRVLDASIYGKYKNIKSSLLESLGHLHNILELRVQCSYASIYASGDAGWLSCQHLRLLCLDYLVFSGLPAWIKSPLTPNLTFLDVKVVVLNDKDMETLAKLPELSRLKLHSESDTKSVVSIKIPTNEGGGCFRKLRILRILGASIWFDLRGSECNSSKVASNNSIMPSLEYLEFGVHVRLLKDKNLHLSFHKLLGFQNLGTSSLRQVHVQVNCEDARTREVEEVEAALKQASAVHPKHPTLYLRNTRREALLEIIRETELVIKAWKLVDIIGSEHIQIMHLPDPAASSSKVIRLLYTYTNGVVLLALSSDAVHKVWKWEHSDNNLRGKVRQPVFWQPANGILMKNDTTDGNDPEEATACTALSRNDGYLLSASGGKVSLFNILTFKVMATFMAPPPAATFLAFHPIDNNIIAIGRDDSSIQIYNVRTDTVKIVLTGHQKKITGLAFSQSMEVLVSSGADAQLCVWSIDTWEKKKSRYIKHPSNGSTGLVGDTLVQFHYDETHLLVVHESQLVIYDWQLELLCSWFPRDALPATISSAVYSLGCLLVYAGFRDGAIGIFDAKSLTLKCRIAPSAYIPCSISRDGETVYPTVVATHPRKPNQIAVGMSDGAVLVLEPYTDDEQVGSDDTSSEHSSGGDNQSMSDSAIRVLEPLDTDDEQVGSDDTSSEHSSGGDSQPMNDGAVLVLEPLDTDYGQVGSDETSEHSSGDDSQPMSDDAVLVLETSG